MQEKTEALLTVQEVATLLGVHETAVRHWIKVATLTAVTLPHQGKRATHRIRRSTVQSILTHHSPTWEGNGNTK